MSEKIEALTGRGTEIEGDTAYEVDYTDENLRKLKMIVMDGIETTLLRDVKFEIAYMHFIREQVHLRLTGHWWGVKVGLVRVSFPATWWQLLKSTIYERYPRFFNKVGHFFGDVRYTRRRDYQVRALFPQWQPPPEIKATDPGSPYVFVVD
jgi:hypothetical protein